MAIRSFFLLWLIPGVVSALDLPTLVVEKHAYPIEQLLDGTVEAVNQATMSAQTSGRIEKIFFDVDDYVERGNLVVQLRDAAQQAALKQAEAAVSEARARLQEAQDEHNRVRDIYQRKLVAKAALDKAVAALKAAKARLDQAEAARKSAQEQLDYTRMRAPYSGIVTERHVEPGEAVQPGTPVLTGLSLEKLRLVTRVPQRYVEQVRQATYLQVYWGYGQIKHQVSSSKITVYPYADTAEHGFRVRINLPEATDYHLYPGMLVKVGLAVGEKSSLSVPAGAVVYRGELAGVYLLGDDGKLLFRQVRPGIQYQDQTLILAGLVAGDKVVTDPAVAVEMLKQQEQTLE